MYPVRADVSDEFYATLLRSHRVRVRVEVLDRYERVKADLTLDKPAILAGEVQVDTTRGGATRTLSLDILSEDHEWFCDPSDPASPIWLTDYLAVHYGVWLASLHDFYEVPLGVFTIDKPSHAGSVLHIDGADKGRRNMDPFRTRAAYSVVKKAWKKSDAIRSLMVLGGESRFKITPCAQTMGADATYAPGTELWAAALAIASSTGWGCFYDGSGALVLRPQSAAPVWTFRPDDSSSLLEDVKVEYDISVIRNWVQQKGKGTIACTAWPPASHPLHPGNIDPDAPVFLSQFEENPYITTHAQAQNAADKRLVALLAAGTSVSFSSLVIPTLEEYDQIRIEDPRSRTYATVPLQQFTIPLVSGGMTIGTKFNTKAGAK